MGTLKDNSSSIFRFFDMKFDKKVHYKKRQTSWTLATGCQDHSPDCYFVDFYEDGVVSSKCQWLQLHAYDLIPQFFDSITESYYEKQPSWFCGLIFASYKSIVCFTAD